MTNKPATTAQPDPVKPLVKSDFSGVSSGGGEIVSSLKPAEFSREVREVDYTRLKAVLSQMRIHLDLSSEAVAELKRETPRRAVVAKRSEAELAFDQVRFREEVLRISIARAATAPAETAGEAQAQVASDYEAYARAVAAAESMSRVAAE